MNVFIRALMKVCRERRLEEKLLVAPSLRVGHQWIEAVARAGQPVVNVRVKTPLHLALDLAGPSLGRDGLALAGALDALMLVRRAWIKLVPSARGGYLLALAPSPSLLDAVYASLSDLRLAGVRARDLGVRAFEVATKGSELAALLDAYESELHAMQRVDRADVLRRAGERLRSEPAALGQDTLVLLPADAEFVGLERELLALLPEAHILRLPVDEPLTPEPGGSHPRDLALLRWLSSPEDAPPLQERRAADCDNSARILRAMGQVNEVRQALRRIVADGVPLDDVELLHTDAETYVTLVYELAAGLRREDGPLEGGLPVTFAEGIPARSTRPGRALLAWLDWQREDYPQAILVRMLQDGLLSVSEANGEPPPFAHLANVLRPIPIGLRRERYLPAIDRRIDALERRLTRPLREAEDDEEDRAAPSADVAERLRTTRLVRALVGGLLDGTPEREATQAGFLAAARDFLTRLARGAGEDDEYARRRLFDEIETLEPWLREGDVPCFDPRAWLAELPGRVRIKGSGPRPGCLHVADLASGGHSSRSHTFILGLDDSRFPGAGTQDPVLLDDERQKVSPDLPTAADRLRVRLDGFARLLARLRGSLTLSFSCRSLDDDREMFASPVVLAAYRILSGNRDGDHADLDRWLDPPASFAPDSPERCLDDADWWLWRFCGPESVGNAAEVLGQHFPRLSRGLLVAEMRRGCTVTPYDGLVPEAGRDLDPTAPQGAAMSASRLEDLGACPLRYFFAHVLGIKPPVELVLDPACWLDHGAFGSLLHEVFCAFIRQLRAEGLLPSFARNRSRLDALLDAKVRETLELVPPPSESVFQRQRRELERTAHTFLREEEELCRDSEPLCCEAAIGLPRDAEGTPLDTPDPLSITLPGDRQFRARGRIDRVDRVGEPCRQTFAVWDYKTGRSSRFDPAKPFRQGRIVQHWLNLRLVEERLRQGFAPDAQVKSFGYFFPGVHTHGERITWEPADLADGPAVIARLVAIAASGCFIATNNNESNRRDCDWCNYKPICGDLDALAAASQAKLDDPANTILTPFRELRTP